ncbi:MAG: Alkaline phosphatase [Ramlibacter sp.]|nr:Alkaline phosphatase [Ramlibacter sp.]
MSQQQTSPDAMDRRRFVLAGGALLAGSAGGLTACGGGGTESQERFGYGVASGDPLSDRVILWTRVNGVSTSITTVQWEVASDAAFTTLVASGSADTGPDRDFTVKVDATGLQPATRYWYRFRQGTEVSTTGRTRTLPVGDVGQVRMAIFSCAAFPLGQFHVYADAADRGDIDVALHLGDYIYETGLSDVEQAAAALLGRKIEPRGELVSLSDYRARYAHYHTDVDLRNMHAAMPVIAVWDDHEIVNDTWRNGAGGHDPATEGDFATRRGFAAQAWREWLPVRLPDPANPLKIYRSFQFGKLATLHMLDTRVIARDAPIGRDAYLAGAANDPNRQLLGQEQQDWLTAGMTGSTATWQVLGQQVLFGRMQIPLSVFDDFTQSRIDDYLSALDKAPAARTPAQQALVDQAKIPHDLDTWDGFPAAREKVLAAAKALDKNLVVVSGDSHNAFASDLRDASGQVDGVEFAGPSVTSTGLEIEHTDIGRQFLADSFVRMMPDLRFAETSHRGYVLLTLTPQAARADYIFVSSVLENSFSASVGRSLQTLPGAGNRKVIPA